MMSVQTCLTLLKSFMLVLKFQHWNSCSGSFAEREIRSLLSTDFAKHPVGHAIMTEMGKAGLALDIEAHPGMAPLRTVRWSRAPAGAPAGRVDGGGSQPVQEEVAYVVVHLSVRGYMA